MYIKRFWVIFASYRKFGSKWIRGSVPKHNSRLILLNFVLKSFGLNWPAFLNSSISLPINEHCWDSQVWEEERFNIKQFQKRNEKKVKDCIRAPPRRGRYWKIHPRRPKDFPRPERFPEGEARGKSRGSREIWSTDTILTHLFSFLFCLFVFLSRHRSDQMYQKSPFVSKL